MAALIDAMKKALEPYGGKWSEKKGVWDFSTTIAERKAFLSKKKLTYAAKIRLDEGAKVVKFSEMLVEASSGLSTGGFEDDTSAGFGFKTESYNTLKGPRQGSIEEQSQLFGKDFSYHFHYAEVRSKVKDLAEQAGYTFEYQILPVQ